MNITIQNTEKLRKVAVLGQLELPSECEQLLTILKPDVSSIAPLELDFYDADLLPSKIIEAISELVLVGIPLMSALIRVQ